VQTGFAEPETLLPFLMDTHAFDLFVDAVGLKAAEHRNLWKALGNRQIRFQPNESSNMSLSLCDHYRGVVTKPPKCYNVLHSRILYIVTTHLDLKKPPVRPTSAYRR
jgi:hypothetical protein